jgi:hypothetical protein
MADEDAAGSVQDSDSDDLRSHAGDLSGVLPMAPAGFSSAETD